MPNPQRKSLVLYAMLTAAALAVGGCASLGTTQSGAHPSSESNPAPSNEEQHQGDGDKTSPPPAPSTTPSGEPSTSGNPSPSSTETPTTTAPPPTVPAGQRVNCAKVKCVALTFDDGPGPYTNQILDALSSAGARATFFLVGTQIERYQDTVKREASLGMELGNHTWDHPDLTKLSPAAQLQELKKVDDALQGLVGVTPTFLRPPGGALTKKEKVALQRPIADWAVDTLDWKTRNTQDTITAASAAKPGDIVLMHDIHAPTAAAVPQIIKNLQAKGYHLVTLTELIGDHPTLGIAYGWGRKPAGS